jgi:hypothetical protein
LLTQYENVTEKVLFGNAVLVALDVWKEIYFKMMISQEKVMCVIWFLETNAVLSKMQHRYRTCTIGPIGGRSGDWTHMGSTPPLY